MKTAKKQPTKTLKLIGFSNDFYYKKFTKQQQELISKSVKAMVSMAPELLFSPKLKLTLEDYQIARKFITYEVPELFMCDFGPYVASPHITKIVLVYEAGADLIQSQIFEKCHQIVKKSTKTTLAQDYLEFISKNSKYGNVAEKNMKHSQFNPTGPFLGVAVCSGFSKLFKLLCKMLNKPAICVTGPASNGENHAWNMQKIGMSWYNLDFTWCIKQEFPRYFNVSNKFLGHRSDSKIKLPVCNTDKQSFLYKNKMHADTPEDIQKCMREQIKKGKVCIFNNKFQPQDVLQICQNWLTEYEKEVKAKLCFKNVEAHNGNQIVFNVVKDTNYNCYQTTGKCYANVIHVLFVLGDKTGLISPVEKKQCISLLSSKKLVKIQIISNGNTRKVYEAIQTLIYECSFHIKKYITANNVGFLGDDITQLDLGLDQRIRVLSPNNKIAQGQKCFMHVYGKEYQEKLGPNRVIKFEQFGEYCLFEVVK